MKYGGGDKTLIFDRTYKNTPSVYVNLADSTGKPVDKTYGGYRPFIVSVSNTQAIISCTSVSETVGAYVAVAVISND